MKKATAIILALIMCAALALPAFADGMGPFYSEITAYVSKKGGAAIYDYLDNDNDEWSLQPTGEKIPYQTELILTWNTIDDDELYYSVKYNDESVYVRGADLSVDSSPIAPKEKNKYDPPIHFVVINEDGAVMRAGPNEIYDEITTLPKGTEIEAAYADGHGDGGNDGEEDEGITSWSYTTYDGESGWVHTGQEDFCYDFAIPVKYKEMGQSPLGEFVALEDVNVYRQIDFWDNDEVLTVIPAGTRGSFDCYYYGHHGEISFPYEYNGEDGWVVIENSWLAPDNIMITRDGYIMVTDSLDLYEDDDLTPGENLSETVEPYQIIPYDYAFRNVLGDYDRDDEEYWDSPYEQWFRVTVDGKKCWVCFGSETNGDPVLFYSGSYEKYSGDIDIFEEPDVDSAPVGSIPKDSKYINLFNYDRNDYYEDENGDTVFDRSLSWEYVDYNGTRGWIHFEDEEYPDYIYGLVDPVLTLGEDDASPAGNTETGDDEGDGTDDNSPGGFLENLFGKKDEDENNPLAPESPRKTIGASIAGAAVAVVLAIIGISRARKKKEE